MISTALAAIRQGNPVVVTDDADRENEGDLVIAADAVSAEVIAFMAVHCRGLICLAMEPARLDALDLGPMVPGVAAETNFAVSFDFDEPGSTGISARDRARTIRAAVDPGAVPADFRRPGHVFPLRYTPGGVLARRGHTEASVDLARLAGRTPAGVICEILNDDGTMARGEELLAFARRHDLPVISVAELADHLCSLEDGQAPVAAAADTVVRVVDTVLPTRFGTWRATGFRGSDGLEYVALSTGELTADDAALVRLHSECLTGDALGSRRCDCGEQLEMAMERISTEGAGVVVYIRGHEGRGIGLLPKLQAYALQDLGRDTVDANIELGYQPDARSYPGAAEVLRMLGLRRVRLLTNNARKVAGLVAAGISVEQRISLFTVPYLSNLRYLDTKRTRLGHELPSLRQLSTDAHRECTA
jgi:3,4-dihydroxy 2-butanone 4-phosphate synthase/GTP cyclohydrolase II